MKKKQLPFFALFAVCLFFSCKREKANETKPSSRTYKVTFNVSDFTQTILNTTSKKKEINSLKVDSATNNIAAYTAVLDLSIFDAQGNLVRKLQQAAGAANYGIVADSLAAGTYTVVIDAGQSLLKLSAGEVSTSLPLHPDLTTGILYYRSPVSVGRPANEGPWFDTFYKKFQLTVTNAPINQNVILDRIVSKLEVDFNDAIPLNAARVDVFVRKESFEFGINNGLPQTVNTDTITFHYPIPASAKGTSNYSVSQIMLNTGTPFSVILTAYDSANKIIAIHSVDNVTCQANKRTILTGNFSSTSPDNSLKVSLNSSWGAPTTVNY
jgi:hypothetical protein